MILAKLALSLLALLTPTQSAAIAANALQAPDVARALAEVCHRESRCNPIGVHTRDARWSGRVFWRAASQRWLDLRCQNMWQGNWSTRGSFGLMAAYNARLVAPCTTPEYFDVPLISALVAAMKLVEHCDRPLHHRHPATTRWAFGDRICNRVPYAHARSPAYVIARARVRILLSTLMPTPHNPARPDAKTPSPDGHSDEATPRRDARDLPRVEPPETRTDGAKTPKRERMG